MIREIVQKVYQKENLTREMSQQAMETIMEGKWTPAQIAAFLVALHMKGESVTEISSFARVMRDKSSGSSLESKSGAINSSLNSTLFDTCGTGGDNKGLFNVSTAASFVLASCGVRVAKHGNRAVTSASGSADILQKMGCNIELNRDQVIHAIEQLGIGFLFAQSFHPAMRFVAPVRQELGIRTVFNILGPLANPLHAQNQMMGVFAPGLSETLIHVLYELGENNGVVFHSDDGMDEVSIFAPTRGFYFQNRGEVRDFYVDPADLEIHNPDMEAVLADSQEKAVKIFEQALSGENQAAADMVALNAAVGLWLMQKVGSVREGLDLARTNIKSGQVTQLLEQYIALTNRF